MSDDDLSVFNRPAPKKDDVVFGPGSDWHRNAFVAHWNTPWAYTEGFRRAGQLLAQHVCDAGTDQDVLIYPIVYLYRHHVELILKAIIKSAAGLLDRDLSEHEAKVVGRHSLLELWQACCPLLNPVCDRAGEHPFFTAELEGVGSYIQQIHEHDPDGQRFRYATTRVKRPDRSHANVSSLSPSLERVNIRLLANAMEKLADYLENIEGWFGHLEEAKREWEHQYEP